MDWRELIDGGIVLACGAVLLSPEFNTFLSIPFISFIQNIPSDVISHLAIGLLPLILVYLVRLKWVQIAVLSFVMVLMLSKHYTFFYDFFSLFYETRFSFVSVAIGGVSVLHGALIMGKSFVKHYF